MAGGGRQCTAHRLREGFLDHVLVALEMKKAGAFAASVAAASSAALASVVSNHHDDSSTRPSQEGSGSSRKKDAAGSGSRKGAEDKFAPRFDGLRFIETLVTAHR
ncbi:uncharacterized protein LOC141811418 [Curcuma longa]|uniref:uncharacterized protein LOC141811418 n=1 Tax=Curcuma longa TaxID=136217 RepID=UPI003D9F5147